MGKKMVIEVIISYQILQLVYLSCEEDKLLRIERKG